MLNKMGGNNSREKEKIKSRTLKIHLRTGEIVKIEVESDLT
jgi:hypothetical protein